MRTADLSTGLIRWARFRDMQCLACGRLSGVEALLDARKRHADEGAFAYLWLKVSRHGRGASKRL